MITSINDKQYKVRFLYAQRVGNSYYFGGTALTDVQKKPIFTFCEIATRVNKDEDWLPIAGDFAIRSTADEFRKAKGRRAALGFAVRQIGDKAIRTKIWQDYFKSTLDGKTLNLIKDSE